MVPGEEDAILGTFSRPGLRVREKRFASVLFCSVQYLIKGCAVSVWSQATVVGAVVRHGRIRIWTSAVWPARVCLCSYTLHDSKKNTAVFRPCIFARRTICVAVDELHFSVRQHDTLATFGCPVESRHRSPTHQFHPVPPASASTAYIVTLFTLHQLFQHIDAFFLPRGNEHMME